MLLKMDSCVVVDGVGVGVDDAKVENMSARGLDVVVVSYLSAVDGSTVDGRIVVLVVLEINFFSFLIMVDVSNVVGSSVVVLVDVLVVLGIRYGADVVVVSALATVVKASIAALAVLCTMRDKILPGL